MIFDSAFPMTPDFVRPDPVATAAAANDCVVRRLDPALWDEQFAEYRDIVHEQTACFNMARWPAGALQFLTVERQNRIIGGAVVRTVKAPAKSRQAFDPAVGTLVAARAPGTRPGQPVAHSQGAH